MVLIKLKLLDKSLNFLLVLVKLVLQLHDLAQLERVCIHSILQHLVPLCDVAKLTVLDHHRFEDITDLVVDVRVVCL